MKKNILAILLVGVSSESFATTQAIDAPMMMKMMQLMQQNPVAFAQMMEISNAQTVTDTTVEIQTLSPHAVTASDLDKSYSDVGRSISELSLDSYDFSKKENLEKVVNFFKNNQLVNLKIIDLSKSQNVELFFNSIFSQRCTMSLSSLQWIKVSHSTGLTPSHVSNVLLQYFNSYSQCTRDMRKWSARHDNTIAAFIRVDVDGISAFKDTPLWKGVLTRPVKVVYRSQEDPDIAPVIIRTEG